MFHYCLSNVFGLLTYLVPGMYVRCVSRTQDDVDGMALRCLLIGLRVPLYSSTASRRMDFPLWRGIVTAEPVSLKERRISKGTLGVLGADE